MKAIRILSVLMSMAVIFCTLPFSTLTAGAETSGTTGDCTWTLVGTVLTISGNGEMGKYDDMENSSPWDKSITKVIIENGVTNISDCAFEYCHDLSEISIASTVNNIGYGAFSYCNNLKQITLPEGLIKIGARAFEQCHILENIFIPSTVVSIASNPFLCCSNLESIEVSKSNDCYFSDGDCLVEKETGTLISGCKNSVIPENVGIKTIGYRAFSSIENFKKINIPYGVEKINRYAFWGCENSIEVIIPETVTSIDVNALRFLHPQVNITINSKNKTYKCAGNCIIEIESGTIITGYSNSLIPRDDNVTKIGEGAFYGSMALISIDIPDNITCIDSEAFGECRNLLDVHIGEKVNYINPSAFAYCRNLETITVDKNNEVYHAHGNCLIEMQSQTLIRGTKESVIPSDGTVKKIGECAFWGTEIPSVKIPEGVIEIESSAFTGIVEVELPNSIKTIGELAFGDSLERVLYNGTVEERDSITISDLGNENLVNAEWQYGIEWVNSVIEFSLEDTCVIQKCGISPGDDDLEYELFSYNSAIKIGFKDGTVLNINTAEPEMELFEKTGREIHYYDNQSYANQWGVGEHTVTVYFMGATTEFTVTVLENPIQSFEIKPVELIQNCDGYWYEYDTCPQDMIVYFKDGSEISGNWHEVVTQLNDKFNLHNLYTPYYDSLYQSENQILVGAYLIFVRVLGHESYYTVNIIPKTLEKITVSTLPTKTNYSMNDDVFDTEGGIVTLLYNNGEKEFVDLSDCIISGFTNKTVGKQIITVTYGEKNDFFEIAINCEHTYVNTCDTSCDVCGNTRKINHSFLTASCTLPKTCKVCKVTSGKALGHKYNNNCDTKCNVCSATRKITHLYKTTTTKATISKSGKIVKKCTVCDKVASTKKITYPKTIKLSKSEYTYNGEAKKPSVTVKDASGKKLTEDKDYTVTYPSGRKKVGSYKVKIKFKGNYSGTEYLTFKINPKTTKVSSVSAGKKSLKVKIKKQSSQTTGYEVQYSTSKKFSSAKTKKITSNKTTSVTLKSLKAKKTYYVRVRTYKTVNGKRYYSAWSSYKSKKTK